MKTLTTDDRGCDSSINWGAYRENAYDQLPRFDSLPHGGIALIRSYQTVLERNETFTQYFTKQHLESYDAEANLREQMGIPPSFSNPEDPASEAGLMLSWVNIIRQGDFEMQSDGSFLCRTQGKVVEIDKSLHTAIAIYRSMHPLTSNAWPSHADVDKETKISLAIEADILEEVNNQSKYLDKLKQLQLALERRRKTLQRSVDPQASAKKGQIPQGLRTQYSTPSQLHPKVTAEPHDSLTRRSSESSDVSTGSDISFTGGRNGPKSMSIDSSDAPDLNITACTANDQSKENEKEKPASALENGNQEIIFIDDSSSVPSTRVTPVNDDRGNISSKALSTKRSLRGIDDEGVTKQRSKKSKSENTTPPPNSDTLDQCKKPRMLSEQPRESHKAKERKRKRKNFTEYEKENAPAWLRAQYDAHRPSGEIERAYVDKFGVRHRSSTLKSWLERMEEQAQNAEMQHQLPTVRSHPESLIVKLKTTPLRHAPKPQARIMPASEGADPGIFSPAYFFPYPEPDYRFLGERRASSAGYSLDLPRRPSLLGSPSIKSGLPNV